VQEGTPIPNCGNATRVKDFVSSRNIWFQIFSLLHTSVAVDPGQFDVDTKVNLRGEYPRFQTQVLKQAVAIASGNLSVLLMRNETEVTRSQIPWGRGWDVGYNAK
jgi:hypothetical protein